MRSAPPKQDGPLVHQTEGSKLHFDAAGTTRYGYRLPYQVVEHRNGARSNCGRKNERESNNQRSLHTVPFSSSCRYPCTLKRSAHSASSRSPRALSS